jgi:hypothetical protein
MITIFLVLLVFLVLVCILHSSLFFMYFCEDLKKKKRRKKTRPLPSFPVHHCPTFLLVSLFLFLVVVVVVVVVVVLLLLLRLLLLPSVALTTCAGCPVFLNSPPYVSSVSIAMRRWMIKGILAILAYLLSVLVGDVDVSVGLTWRWAYLLWDHRLFRWWSLFVAVDDDADADVDADVDK